jgi:hypothetical protein
MAKEYVTLEEACEILGKSADDVKGMVADGRLTEVRDAGRVFFKKTEVDLLAKEGSSIVDLALTDVGEAEETESFASALSSLSDSSSGMSLLEEQTPPPSPEAPAEPVEPKPASELAELTLEDIPEDLPAAPPDEVVAGGAGSDLDLMPLAEATAEAPPAAVPDLGLSGSSILGLEPESPPGPKAPPKEEARPGKVGISVFDDDELPVVADPMGETQISAGVPELDTVGSGSGLLDLTRESDDTSLGAELLDVISPSGATVTETKGEAVEAAETLEDSGGTEQVAIMEPAQAPFEKVLAPVAARSRAADAAVRGAVPLNVCLIIGLLGSALAALATASAIQGVWPGFLSLIARDIVHYAVFGGLALAVIVTGVLSILADRSA